MGRLPLGALVLLLLLRAWTAVSGDGDGGDGGGGGGGAATDVQPGARLPVARTYRTAYGTHFDRSSTWPLLLGAHVLLVVGGLLLLSVIPVRFASVERREAPFVLWFGSPRREGRGEEINVKVKVADQRVEKVQEKQQQLKVEQQNEGQVGSVQTESLWQRVSAWLGRTLAGLFAASPPPARDIDALYRFHADMTQQLAAASAKTYESIAVSTEDLQPTLQPPLHHAEEGLPERKEPPRQLSRPPSRSSIFAGAPSSPPSGARLRRQGSVTISEASTGRPETLSRRASRESSGPGGVVTVEDFIRAASRRQSMEARVEKREALAQEDISYENLGDEEIRTYEYLEFIRELLDGLGVKKLCQKSGRVVSRTLYITPDMLVVFWNTAGTFKRMRTKSSIHTETIEEVLTGIHGSRGVTAKSTPERDALCVSIRCSTGKWLVLQAKTEAMRQRLFLGFSRLAQEKQEQDAAAAAEAVEPTIPEVGEDEEAEESIGRKEEKTRLKESITSTSIKQVTKSHTQVVSSAYEVEITPVQQKVEEQDIYEEKAPAPPSEDVLLRSELHSIRASYENQATEDEKKEAAQNAEDQVQSVGGPPDDAEVAAPGKPQPSLELEHEEEKETREEDEHKAGERPPSAVDEVDIDNLSDDPELSRE